MAAAEPEVIEVACVAFPDGRTYWLPLPDDDERHAALTQVWDGWRAQLPADKRSQLEVGGCQGGFVVTRMLRADFDAIPATSWSAAIAQHGKH